MNPISSCLSQNTTFQARGDDTCSFLMAPPDMIHKRIEEHFKKHPELREKSYVEPKVPGFLANSSNASAAFSNMGK